MTGVPPAAALKVEPAVVEAEPVEAPESVTPVIELPVAPLPAAPVKVGALAGLTVAETGVPSLR